MRKQVLRRMERTEWSIFVFCDSKQHPGRRVAVTNFDQFGPLGAGGMNVSRVERERHHPPG